MMKSENVLKIIIKYRLTAKYEKVGRSSESSSLCLFFQLTLRERWTMEEERE
jgi:hypothetical protein